MPKTHGSGSFGSVSMADLNKYAGNVDSIIVSKKWLIAQGIKFKPVVNGIVVSETSPMAQATPAPAAPVKADVIPVVIHKPKSEADLANI